MSKAHVSINVSDLPRAVAFYKAFLGVEPSKHYKDYAKFELDEPPFVLSLEPVHHRAADAFNHLGLRMPDPAAVIEVQARLERAGVLSEREDDVECCYSRQTKFWLADPDRNLWEVYALTADIPHRGALASSDAMVARDRGGRARVFDHRLGDSFASPLPLADASVDDVRLRGTFNTPVDDAERRRILTEALRVLTPGGTILVHGLVADRPLSGGFPRLPGPAALVKHVPLESEPASWLAEAGFAGVYIQKLGELPNFQHDGCRMRELMVVGWKPEGAENTAGATVVYRGPFASVTDEGGRTFRRGERVALDAPEANRLRRGPIADQLVFVRDRK